MEKKIVNIVGPIKNGTTLTGALIDYHPQISSFPLEMKFITHLRKIPTQKLNTEEFKKKFLMETKIKYLLNKDNSDEHININLGIFEKPIKFNYELFKETFIKKETRNIEEFIIKIHESLDLSLGIKPRNLIVIQDGNHLLKNKLIEYSMDNLKYAEFIVIYRNPLDVYVSYRTYSENLKIWRNNILNFVTDTLNNYLYLIYYKEKNLKNFHFLSYENLVNNCGNEMQKLCDFLKVKYSNTLNEPTILGSKWTSNSSSVNKTDKVVKINVDKYKDHLNEIEQKFIFFNFNSIFYSLYPAIQKTKERIKRSEIIFICLKSFKNNTKKNWKLYLKFFIVLKDIFLNILKNSLKV